MRMCIYSPALTDLHIRSHRRCPAATAGDIWKSVSEGDAVLIPGPAFEVGSRTLVAYPYPRCISIPSLLMLACCYYQHSARFDLQGMAKKASLDPVWAQRMMKVWQLDSMEN